MALLSVEEALRRILDGVAPTDVESVPIGACAGRTLASPLAARLTQPPFNSSAMDGYAVCAADVQSVPAKLALAGEAAAGHPFAGTVRAGQAVRIFTGAPVPEGADCVVIQENTTRDDTTVVVKETGATGANIRPCGGDFRKGQALLEAGRRIGAREITLAAAMGHAALDVRRRPIVAVLSTGDELVEPGTTPGPGQIVASNHLGIATMAEACGARVVQLGIARDTRESLSGKLAEAASADILVTIGGASVGDHDLVAPVLQAHGVELAFWKIALRPGKPLMYGRLDALRVLGVPGNPVSALVCARVFLVPLILRLLGRADADTTARARSAVALPANGPRQHYMRASMIAGADGVPSVAPAASQDSSLLATLASASCLLVRPPDAPAVPAGAEVAILPLDF